MDTPVATFSSLARRAEPINFNDTTSFPTFAKLNASSTAVLQSEADRLASPDQLDGFSISILVALYAIYLLFLLAIAFMRTFLASRYHALPSATQRQCAGLLASALVMSSLPPLLGYALSAAKWDINELQIRIVRIAAIIVSAFALFDLVHRDRQSLLMFIKRTVTLGAVSCQLVLFDRVNDPSFIISLAALIFVAFTEPPVFFGLFLYKIRCPAKWTKFILHSAVGQTVVVKSLGTAIGAYVWVKFQRQNASTLGKASSAVYLASLIILLTCQILIVIPIYKLAKEVDERYAAKGPLQLKSSKSKRGGRRAGGRRSGSNDNELGPVHAVHGRLRRHNNDRLSTFNMHNLHRDSLEMDEKRRPSEDDDDLEAASSYKSGSLSKGQNDFAASEKRARSPSIAERLRSLSPVGRKSTNFSRPTKSALSTHDTKLGAMPSSSKYREGESDYDNERGVPILSFHSGGNSLQQNAQNGMSTEYLPTNSRATSATASYSSPHQVKQHLDDPTPASPRGASSGLRSHPQDVRPQIIISTASSSAHAGRDSETSSTLQEHRFSNNSPSYVEDGGWNSRTVSGSTMTNPFSPSYNADEAGQGAAAAPAGFRSVSGASSSSIMVASPTFRPGSAASVYSQPQPSHNVGGGLINGMQSVDETSRYALGIVQEYLEPSESPYPSDADSMHGASGEERSVSAAGTGTGTGTEWASAVSPNEFGGSRPFSTEPEGSEGPGQYPQQQQQQYHTYTVPQHSSRPRMAPSPAAGGPASPSSGFYESDSNAYNSAGYTRSQPIQQRSRFEDSYDGVESALAYMHSHVQPQPSQQQQIQQQRQQRQQEYAYGGGGGQDGYRMRMASAPHQRQHQQQQQHQGPPFLADL